MKLHVFPASPNTRKVLVVNSLLGLDLPAEIVDLQSGAQRAPEFLALNPNGRVPVLEYDDGSTLWESNAIINRLCAEVDTPLWPKSNARYDIMRWQFWESCHWTPACSKFISRYIFGNEGVDLEEATQTFHQFAAVLDGHLKGRDWLSGDGMTTADISVGAILCYREPCHFPVANYANIQRWIAALEALDAWQAANPAPQAA
ncbi:glutathione S-transferase family protein [Ruegeria sp. HKCCD8929]|uniref:glutathione S-transferase family protein n=1 Tax=Ruegeria sp. HKCCD8929 TaxID=2683006 RepID=UPI00148902BE|nr:glutathione S-transferase family protein [Ruegeria sp. HKCCD8929]